MVVSKRQNRQRRQNRKQSRRRQQGKRQRQQRQGQRQQRQGQGQGQGQRQQRNLQGGNGAETIEQSLRNEALKDTQGWKRLVGGSDAEAPKTPQKRLEALKADVSSLDENKEKLDPEKLNRLRNEVENLELTDDAQEGSDEMNNLAELEELAAELKAKIEAKLIENINEEQNRVGTETDPKDTDTDDFKYKIEGKIDDVVIRAAGEKVGLRPAKVWFSNSSKLGKGGGQEGDDVGVIFLMGNRRYATMKSAGQLHHTVKDDISPSIHGAILKTVDREKKIKTIDISNAKIKDWGMAEMKKEEEVEKEREAPEAAGDAAPATAEPSSSE